MTDHPDPTRVVADADVLAADLLVGGGARAALDLLRASGPLTIVLTERLLADAHAVIATLAEPELADDWEARIRRDANVVSPTVAGHPALAAAATAGAASVLSLDDELRSPAAGVALRSRVATSVKSPDAFVSLVERSGFEGRSSRE